MLQTVNVVMAAELFLHMDKVALADIAIAEQVFARNALELAPITPKINHASAKEEKTEEETEARAEAVIDLIISQLFSNK